MTTTRHISFDDDHFEKMKIYMEKHNGNLGAALREIINQAGKYSPRMNSSAIDSSLFKWMLTEIDGLLTPDNVMDELVDPFLINSMKNLEEYINQRFIDLEWDIDLALRSDNDTIPTNVLIEIRGEPQKIKFVASLLSKYLVKNSLQKIPLEIKYVANFTECIRVELARSSKKEAKRSLITFFGGLDEIIKVIKTRPSFWNAIINRHLSSNYNMVTVHRNYFEELLANKIPTGEITIENLAEKPIQEIPLKELLFLIKEVYETSRVVDRVEIDKDTIIMSHNYRNKEAIEKLTKSFIALLEANGHLYYSKSIANTIMFMHRPDVGIKINEIVDIMKMSNSRVDQQLVMFIAFLKGLKEIPDIPLSLTALGRRIGYSLMQEYGRENNINHWNLENFQKALEMIDSKLHRESEWNLDGGNLLYTIKRCGIATDGNMFDAYICHTARETFKGAMSYAFGNRAVLNIKKLLTHGDKFCQVVIQIR